MRPKNWITSACLLWALATFLFPSAPSNLFTPLRSSSSSSSGTTNFYGLAHGAGELQCLTLVSLVLERTSPGPCAEPGMRLMILGLPNQNMTLTWSSAHVWATEHANIPWLAVVAIRNDEIDLHCVLKVETVQDLSSPLTFIELARKPLIFFYLHYSRVVGQAAKIFLLLVLFIHLVASVGHRSICQIVMNSSYVKLYVEECYSVDV